MRASRGTYQAQEGTSWGGCRTSWRLHGGDYGCRGYVLRLGIAGHARSGLWDLQSQDRGTGGGEHSGEWRK